MKHAAFHVIAALALAGCKSQIAVDLYVSDALAVVETGEPLPTSAVLSLEMPTEQTCAELAPAIVEALATPLPGTAFIGCESTGFDTYARFRSELAIRATPEDSALEVIATAEDAGVTLHIHRNLDSLRRAFEAIPEETRRYQDFSFQPTVTAVLNNDLRDDVTVVTDDVFADGQPIQSTREWTLARRGQVEVTLSDVSNAAFADTDEGAALVTIRRP